MLGNYFSNKVKNYELDARCTVCLLPQNAVFSTLINSTVILNVDLLNPRICNEVFIYVLKCISAVSFV